MRAGDGFVAALDQSGGSTPKALKLYGIDEKTFEGNEQKMMDMIHEMRERIVSSAAFTNDRILGVIIFEATMDRKFGGKDAAHFLWEQKGIVPILKVDKGLEAEANGVQLMKPIPDLNVTLKRAKEKGVFGTKMRSVIKVADAEGVKAIVKQQFELGRQILDAGLVPILEPEVDIKSSSKAEAEKLLKAALLEELEAQPPDRAVMFKLTLPSTADFYKELVEHPSVMRVFALSGGYSRAEADAKLTLNKGMIASFSRALTEGLSVKLTDEQFNTQLNSSIAEIAAASST